MGEVKSAPRVDIRGDFGRNAENQAVERADCFLAETDAAAGADPAVDHSSCPDIPIHVGLHRLTEGQVGRGQELAVVLIDDAADS